MDLNKELEKALSSYDFDKMVELCKKGATPEDTILHRVINKDRVDLLDYFLFSKEIPKNISLHYDYGFWGKTPALPYACCCRSINCVEYLLNHPKTCNEFNYEEIAQSCLGQACEGGSYEVMNYLLNHEKTKNYCQVTNDFIEWAISRNRLDFLEELFLKFDKIFLESFIQESRSFSKIQQSEQLTKILKKRILKEDLETNLLSKENKKNSFKKV